MRRKRTLSTLAALLGAAVGTAAGTEPQWTIYKPSNTGVPGDLTLDLYVDGDGKPWIPGFITFWEEGGMSRFDRDMNTWFPVTNVDYPVISSPRFTDIDGATSTGYEVWIGTASEGVAVVSVVMENACPGDVDGDGAVGFGDIVSLLSAWGPCGPPCPQDIDGSGAVTFADLLLLLAAWGPCP